MQNNNSVSTLSKKHIKLQPIMNKSGSNKSLIPVKIMKKRINNKSPSLKNEPEFNNDGNIEI